MENKELDKKKKAIELLNKMDIYKPFIKGFAEKDIVCFSKDIKEKTLWRIISE